MVRVDLPLPEVPQTMTFAPCGIEPDLGAVVLAVPERDAVAGQRGVRSARSLASSGRSARATPAPWSPLSRDRRRP